MIMGRKILWGMFIVLVPCLLIGQGEYEQDIISTSDGELEMTFIGHGTLMFRYQEQVVHVDPAGMFGDYSALPQADVILITHSHGDHYDPAAIEELSTEDTEVVVCASLEGEVDGAVVMENGESTRLHDLIIESVPAYNIVHMRSENTPYHAKGDGNGYVITFGDTRVYVAGDTENTPEMKSLENIHVAFLPMNLPYTLSLPLRGNRSGNIGRPFGRRGDRYPNPFSAIVDQIPSFLIAVRSTPLSFCHSGFHVGEGRSIFYIYPTYPMLTCLGYNNIAQ